MSVKFEDNSIKVKAALNHATIQWLYEASGELEAQVKRNTRVDTGQTKGSWTYKVDEANGEAMVGQPAGKCDLGRVWNRPVCIEW